MSASSIVARAAAWLLKEQDQLLNVPDLTDEARGKYEEVQDRIRRACPGNAPRRQGQGVEYVQAQGAAAMSCRFRHATQEHVLGAVLPHR